MAAPHLTSADPLGAAKSALRRAARARRAAVPVPPGAGEAIARHALPLLADLPPGAVVAGYWPMPGEADPRPLMLALAARGHPLCLPRTPPRGAPLDFRAWAPGGALEAGPMGLRQPREAAATAEPGLLLIPLLAFDRAGRRLGHGGGYYDRSLALRPGARVIGLALAGQEVERVPAGPLDARLPLVVTERGAIPARGEGAG